MDKNSGQGGKQNEHGMRPTHSATGTQLFGNLQQAAHQGQALPTNDSNFYNVPFDYVPFNSSGQPYGNPQPSAHMSPGMMAPSSQQQVRPLQLNSTAPYAYQQQSAPPRPLANVQQPPSFFTESLLGNRLGSEGTYQLPPQQNAAYPIGSFPQNTPWNVGSHHDGNSFGTMAGHGSQYIPGHQFSSPQAGMYSYGQDPKPVTDAGTHPWNSQQESQMKPLGQLPVIYGGGVQPNPALDGHGSFGNQGPGAPGQWGAPLPGYGAQPYGGNPALSHSSAFPPAPIQPLQGQAASHLSFGSVHDASKAGYPSYGNPGSQQPYQVLPNDFSSPLNFGANPVTGFSSQIGNPHMVKLSAPSPEVPGGHDTKNKYGDGKQSTPPTGYPSRKENSQQKTKPGGGSQA